MLGALFSSWFFVKQYSNDCVRILSRKCVSEEKIALYCKIISKL